MSMITSLVKLPVRLTFGTVSLVARTGYSFATALLGGHSGAPPTADDGAVAAEPAPFEWEPTEPDDEETLESFRAAEDAIGTLEGEDATPRAQDVDTQAEDVPRSLPDVDAEFADETRPGPDVDAASAAAPPVDEPVSEEAVVVAEVAEPGAEEGAGAEVSVEEPLPGYHTMKAADVIDWLQTATAAQVAVTELYERANRGRKSVFAAAEQRLKEIQNSPRGS